MRFTDMARRILISEKIVRYDIQVDARMLVDKYFDGDIVLDFPMEYGAFKGAYGKVSATRVNDKITVNYLKMSSVYNMDREMYLSVLCHELIHVKLFRSGVWKDIGNIHHGWHFRGEVDRIAKLGFKVTMSEEALHVDVDTELKLKTPCHVVAIDGRSLAISRKRPTEVEWHKLLANVCYRADRWNTPVKMECFTSSNSELRQYPNPITMGKEMYIDTHGLYAALKKDETNTKLLGTVLVHPGDGDRFFGNGGDAPPNMFDKI